MRPRPVGSTAVLLSAVLLLVLPQSLLAQSSKKLRNLVFEWYQGEVHLSVPGQQQLVPVQRHTSMRVKELSSIAVITNLGWAEYSLDRKLSVAQESDTVLTFVGAEDVARGFVLRLSLNRGTSTFRADPGRHNTVLIQASGIEVRATRKARFRIDADSDSASVTVFDGKVQVTSAEDTREVAKGFTLTYRAGFLTRLAQRKPPVRIYSSSSSNRPFAGFAMAGLSYYSGWPCGWGYGGGLYNMGMAPFHGAWGGCGWPYDWTYWYGYSNQPPPLPPQVVPVPVPVPVPRAGTPRPIHPRPREGPRKFHETRELLVVSDEPRPRAGSPTTTIGRQPPRTSAAPEVLISPSAHMMPREDTSFPGRIAPSQMTDRVDIAPIPRERHSGRGNDFSPPSGQGGFRDSYGQGSGSGGPDRQGFNPSSGPGSSGGSAPGSSPGGASPAGAAPAPPPAAPSAPSSHPTPTPRTGKPD